MDNRIETKIKYLKEEIIANSNLIKKANEIDIQHFNRRIDVNKIIEIIDYFTNYERTEKSADENNLYIYYGDPYLTTYLCMKSIINKEKISLFTNEYMIGVNQILIGIFENYGLNLINYEYLYNYDDIKKSYENYTNIYTIGNSVAYQELFGLNNISFIPFFNLIIYCDINEENKELLNYITYYADENVFEYEMLSEDLKENVEYIVNENFTNTVLVISNSKETLNYFKEKIKDKLLYINSNPFKDYFLQIKDI